ncbi:MAG: hypothetical protein E2O46_00160 [Ignavibacteria bacterium]|nr:MAG: hypothetical protein E2O46_00160 [Ignavibacteria bacterium]
MELIDIIKSSILLFSLLLLTIVFISFGLFKIRNQAKDKRLTIKKSADKKFLPKDEGNVEKLNLEQEELPSKEKYEADQKNIDNEKFVVVNQNIKFAPVRNFRVNYHPNVYKFYGDLNSKIIFKIKPETSSHS